MPYKVPAVADLERSLPITVVPGVPEVNPKNPINVSFRQAVSRDDTQLHTWANQEPAIYEYGEQSVRQEVKNNPDSERRAYEVYLTMIACDIVTEDGKTPLFEFSKADGVTEVSASFNGFLKMWGNLPTSITRAIHLKCLEATPEWAYYWASRQVPAGNDDEGEQ